MRSQMVRHKRNRILSSKNSKIALNVVRIHSCSGHLLWLKSFCCWKMRLNLLKIFYFRKNTPGTYKHMNVHTHECRQGKKSLISYQVCNKISFEPCFSACLDKIAPEVYYEQCMEALCVCTSSASECLCPFLSYYSQLCSNRGSITEWTIQVPQCGKGF